ncbi:MAG: hypothetical protein ACRDPO_38660, partial [Streptosporangiaceae bacterium]
PDIAHGAGSISFGLDGSLTIQAGTLGGGMIFEPSGQISAVGPVVAEVSGAPEVWHTLGTPGITGWTSNHGRYRMTPEGEVEFDITLTSNGVAHASSNTVYPDTLPAAYQPAFNRVYPLSLDSTITAGDPYPRLYITTGGAVKISIPSVGASVTDIGGNIRMTLD